MTPEEIIEKWVRDGLDDADSYVFEVGEDISPYPEITIAFDGYGEDDDGNEDQSKQSFAVYIHKDSDAEDFVFPEHDSEYGMIVHRPAEEVFLNVWFDHEDGSFESQFLDECVEKTQVPYDRIVSVIEALEKRFSSPEE
jgi:hypothetical protein